MIIPIYPEYISLNDWSSKLIEDNIYDVLPILQDEKSWKEWGDEVVNTPYLSTFDIPSPLDMDENVSWQEWATQVYNILTEQKQGSYSPSQIIPI